MLAIAVLAPALVVLAWLRDLGMAMNDFYGPRGKLALEQQISSQLSAGFACLIESRYIDAEAHYRLALGLNEELQAAMARNGWHEYDQTSKILMGLADSLAGQHRYSEAAILLEQRAALKPISDDPAAVGELVNRAKAIRVKTGE